MMFYSNEDIAIVGYNSKSDFMNSFIKEYHNCSIRATSLGVFASYDFDTNIGLDNEGYITMKNLHITNSYKIWLIKSMRKEIKFYYLKNLYFQMKVSADEMQQKDLHLMK